MRDRGSQADQYDHTAIAIGRARRRVVMDILAFDVTVKTLSRTVINSQRQIGICPGSNRSTISLSKGNVNDDAALPANTSSS